jgi:hypothetical protein
MREKIDASESAGEQVTTPSKSTERILSASATVMSRAVWAPVFTIRYSSASPSGSFDILTITSTVS